MSTQNYMRKIILSLIAISVFASPILAEKIPVEGWFKGTSTKVGEMWRDSGRRKHFVSAKSTGEITLYGEGFGFKGKAESDWGLAMLDDYGNGRIVTKETWTAEKDSTVQFRGHASCELTSASTTCVMWFKGYNQYKGKILELTFNEKDAAENEEDENPNLYMLEGIVMDEPSAE